MSPHDSSSLSGQSPVYVYGIVHMSDEDIAVPPSDIAAVRIVAEDGLAALVSTLEVEFENKLKDPEQAKRMVLAHHGVLAAVCQTKIVLPMRFATVFSDDASLRAVLRERHAALLAALCRLGSTREWGVKIFCDRAVLRDHLMASPEVATAQSEASAVPRGHGFFLKRRIAQICDAEVERAVARDVGQSRQSLAAVARGEVALKLQPCVVSGRAGDMVWNGAYLVADASEDAFFARIETLRQTLAPSGYHCEITGPWPPFNFADCKLEA